MKDLYKFEKNLKKKLDEAEFPFDEKNWEKAGAMIDASRNNKKPFMFFMLSAIALLITTGAVYFFVNSSSGNSSENQLAVNQETTRIEEIPQVNSAVAETNYPTAAENKKNTAIVNASPASNVSVTNPSNTLAKASDISLTKRVASEQALSATTSNNKATTAEAATKNTNTTNTPEKTNTKNTSSGNTPSQVNEVSKPQSTTNTEKPNGHDVKEIPVVLGNNTSVLPGKTISNNAAGSGSGSTNKLGELNNANNTSANSANPSLVTDSVTDVRTVAANTLIINSGDTLAKVDTNNSDSTANAATAMSIAAPYVPKSTKSILYAELGASYLIGWNTNSTQEANGFNMVAGFNYLQYLNSTISLGVGLQYNTINNLTQSTYTVSRSNYDLGVTKEITSIKYLQLHYVTVPLKLGVNLGKNTIIGVGGNLSMLLIDEYRTEKYRTNNAEPMTEKNQLSTKKGSGYLTGFNPYDIQLSAFFRRNLFKGFSINAEFVYGLSDIKNNAHFKNNNFERSMGAKLSLCYDLFKK